MNPMNPLKRAGDWRNLDLDQIPPPSPKRAKLNDSQEIQETSDLAIGSLLGYPSPIGSLENVNAEIANPDDKLVAAVHTQFLHFAIKNRTFEFFLKDPEGEPGEQKFLALWKEAIRNQDPVLYQALLKAQGNDEWFEEKHFSRAMAETFNNPVLCKLQVVIKIKGQEAATVYMDDAHGFYSDIKKFKADVSTVPMQPLPKIKVALDFDKLGLKQEDIRVFTALLKSIHTFKFEITRDEVLPIIKLAERFESHPLFMSELLLEDIVVGSGGWDKTWPAGDVFKIVRYLVNSEKYSPDGKTINRILNCIPDNMSQYEFKELIKNDSCPNFFAVLLNWDEIRKDTEKTNYLLDLLLEKGLVEEKMTNKLEAVIFNYFLKKLSPDLTIIAGENDTFQVNHRLLCLQSPYFRALFSRNFEKFGDQIDLRKLFHNLVDDHLPFDSLEAKQAIEFLLSKSIGLPRIKTVNEVTYDGRMNLLRYAEFLGAEPQIKRLYDDAIKKIKEIASKTQQELRQVHAVESANLHELVGLLLEVYTPQMGTLVPRVNHAEKGQEMPKGILLLDTEENKTLKVSLDILLEHLVKFDAKTLDGLSDNTHPHNWVVYLEKYAKQINKLDLTRLIKVEPYFIDFLHKVFPDLQSLIVPKITPEIIEAVKKFKNIRLSAPANVGNVRDPMFSIDFKQ